MCVCVSNKKWVNFIVKNAKWDICFCVCVCGVKLSELYYWQLNAQMRNLCVSKSESFLVFIFSLVVTCLCVPSSQHETLCTFLFIGPMQKYKKRALCWYQRWVDAKVKWLRYTRSKTHTLGKKPLSAEASCAYGAKRWAMRLILGGLLVFTSAFFFQWT